MTTTTTSSTYTYPAWLANIDSASFVLLMEKAARIKGTPDMEKVFGYHKKWVGPGNLRVALLAGFRGYLESRLNALDSVAVDLAWKHATSDSDDPKILGMKETVLGGDETLALQRQRQLMDNHWRNFFKELKDTARVYRIKKNEIIEQKTKAVGFPQTQQVPKKDWYTIDGMKREPETGKLRKMPSRWERLFHPVKVSMEQNKLDLLMLKNSVAQDIQSRAAVEEIKRKIEAGKDGGGNYSSKQLMQNLARLQISMVNLGEASWNDDLRAEIDDALKAWTEVATDEDSDHAGFVNLAKSAKSQLENAVTKMWSAQAELERYIRENYREAMEKWRIQDFAGPVLLAPPPTDPQSKQAQNRELKRLYSDGMDVLLVWAGAYSRLVTVFTEVATDYVNWARAWGKTQKFKGLAKEHRFIWLGLQSTRRLCQLAALGTALTLDLLSLGTASAVAGPALGAANIAVADLTECIAGLTAGVDIQRTSDPEVEKYIGFANKTWKERAGRTALRGVYSKAAFVGKKFETLAEYLEWFNERREEGSAIAHLTGTILSAVSGALQSANETAATNAEGWAAAADMAEKLGDPIKGFATHSPIVSEITNGISLVLGVGNDVITFVVPPKLKQQVSDEQLKRMVEQYRAALERRPDKQALKGELLKGHRLLAELSVTGTDTIETTIVYPDGTTWNSNATLGADGHRHYQDDDLRRRRLGAALEKTILGIPKDTDIALAYSSLDGMPSSYNASQSKHTEIPIVAFTWPAFEAAADRGDCWPDDQGRGWWYANLVGQPVDVNGRALGGISSYPYVLVTHEGEVAYQGRTQFNMDLGPGDLHASSLRPDLTNEDIATLGELLKRYRAMNPAQIYKEVPTPK